jgi:hypothetical protein
MANLYQVSQELRELVDSAFDLETGEALPVFEEKRALFGNKAREVAAYVLNVESEAEQAKTAIERIRKNMLEPALKKSEALKDYLANNMAACGITELKANDGSFVVKLLPGRDEAVELDEEATFSPELCSKPKPVPSKSKIKAAILAGQDVPGAMIVRRNRLIIK